MNNFSTVSFTPRPKTLSTYSLRKVLKGGTIKKTPLRRERSIALALTLTQLQML